MDKMKDLTQTKKNRIKNLRKEFKAENLYIPMLYCKLAYEELGFNAKKDDVKELAIHLFENDI